MSLVSTVPTAPPRPLSIDEALASPRLFCAWLEERPDYVFTEPTRVAHCPVAQYLADVTGAHHVAVGPSDVMARLPKGALAGQRYLWPVPDWVRRFVMTWDLTCYLPGPGRRRARRARLVARLVTR